MKKPEFITLSHGAGGLLSQQLIAQQFAPLLQRAGQSLNDAAVITIGDTRVAFTTDSFTVSPLFFPGGDIGSLAVHGTVNDVAMMGGVPEFISLAFVIEEGFSAQDLHRITESVAEAAERCGVAVVTGDTKVVERGAADGLFINTSGLGVVPAQTNIDPKRVAVGDALLINGTIADHGVAVMCAREELDVSGEILSDSAPVADITGQLINELGEKVHALRDPTRGGLAATLNEIATQAGVTMQLDQASLPILPQVSGVCEILGLDPLQVACEGKVLAFVDGSVAEEALTIMKSCGGGKQAAIIGQVISADRPQVRLHTPLGTTRIVEMPPGEILPRIC